MRRRAALGALLAAALVARAHGLARPPLDFHPTRQYHAAVIARMYFYAARPDVPAWRRALAELNRREEALLEPPVMELAATAGFLAAGAERLWIPRLLASLAWIAGAVGLSALASLFGARRGALVAAATYLFVPYAIAASRSFQPDPLMVALVVCAVWALARYHRAPSVRALRVAAALAGAAVFVKVVAAFFVGAVAVALAASRAPAWRALRSWRALGVVALGLAPAALYYADGLLVSGFLRHQSEGRFQPRLLATSYFWDEWWKRLGDVTGHPLLVAALAATALAARGDALRVLAGLWAGYAAFAFAFTYHIHTHDYYSLPLVPAVALAAGVAFARVADAQPPARRRAARALEALAVVAAVVAGTRAAWRRIDASPGPEAVARYEAVAARVGHATRVIVQDANYALPLRYHGPLAVAYWPTDLDRLEDHPELGVDARFRRYYGAHAYDWFVLGDIRQREAQPDLWRWLGAHGRLVEQTADHAIFDLRRAP